MGQKRNPAVVEEAKERDGFTCQKCGLRDPATVEGHHIEPLSVGGIDSVGNVSTLCESCHRIWFTGPYSECCDPVFRTFLLRGRRREGIPCDVWK